MYLVAVPPPLVPPTRMARKVIKGAVCGLSSGEAITLGISAIHLRPFHRVQPFNITLKPPSSARIPYPLLKTACCIRSTCLVSPLPQSAQHKTPNCSHFPIPGNGGPKLLPPTLNAEVCLRLTPYLFRPPRIPRRYPTLLPPPHL